MFLPCLSRMVQKRVGVLIILNMKGSELVQRAREKCVTHPRKGIVVSFLFYLG